MWQLIGVAVTLWLFWEMVRLWHQEDAVEWVGSLSISPAEYHSAVLDEFADEPALQAEFLRGPQCAYRPGAGTFERSTCEVSTITCENDRQQQRDEFKDVSSFLLRSPVFAALPIQSKMPVIDVLMSSSYPSMDSCAIRLKEKGKKKTKGTRAAAPPTGSEGTAPDQPAQQEPNPANQNQ